MGVYQILQEGSSVLRERAKPITKVNDAAIRLLNNLRDTLAVTDRGCGLAAPQIGIAKRAFVVALPDEEIYYEMINPELLDMEGTEEGWEGCLSVPGIEGLVTRADKLRVLYLDREGIEQELIAEGYLARIIQHENDHLDGVLFRDRAVAFHTPSSEDEESETEEEAQGEAGDTA